MRDRWDDTPPRRRSEKVLPTKHTFLHVTVQEYNEKNHHFLVPRLSEQADNDPVRVSAFQLSQKQLVNRKPRHNLKLSNGSESPSPQIITSTFKFPDKSEESESTTEELDKDIPPSISVGFSAAMRPSGYGEGVSVTEVPPSKDTSVATFCDFQVDARFKSSVEICPGQSPVWFQSKVVCHGTTTKKNFRNSVDYVPKMKPFKFEETNYVRPKHLVMTYVSYYDYNAENDRWFTTTLNLVPSTNTNNTVHNFQMKPKVETRRTEVTIINGHAEEVETSDEDKRSVDDLRLEGDINMNIVNKSTTVSYQPPLLMSSGPEDDDEQLFGTTRLSHRTKMVVEAAPTQHNMDGDDYVVYLQGYASTGEVTNHGYARKFNSNGVTNGYLSDDSISEV